MSCPFKNKDFNAENTNLDPSIFKQYLDKEIPKECPFSKFYKEDKSNLTQNQRYECKDNEPKKNLRTENNLEDSDEEQQTGGCPIINKGK